MTRLSVPIRHERPLELTRKRLWYLYLLAGFIKAEITELTGWSHHQIDYALRKWNLTFQTSLEYWRTALLLEHSLMKEGSLGLDVAAHSKDPLELRLAGQGKLQEMVRDGRITFEEIDATIAPFELDRDAPEEPDRSHMREAESALPQLD